MNYQFFIPYAPPKKWTLLDLLFWMSCQKIPICQYDDEGIEYRESPQTLFDHSEYFGETCLGALTKNDFKRLKIKGPQPNEFENREINKLRGEYPTVDVFKAIIGKSKENLTIQKEMTEKYQGLRSRSRKYKKHWANINRDKLDYWKARLLISLHDGDLVAEGIKLEKTKNPSIELNKACENQETLLSSFIEIPRTRWISHKINWEQCSLASEKNGFYSIKFNRSDVLKTFPPIIAKNIPMSACGDALITKERTGLSMKPSFGGRPVSHDWHAIDVKIAERLLYYRGLVVPQDSLVYEIQHWHLNEFDQSISSSTVSSRLKKYYDCPEIKGFSDN